MFSSRKSAAPAAAGGYTIAKSLRFRSSASAYLNRTPGSASNRKTYTWSSWIKRGSLGTGYIFGATTDAWNVNWTLIYFNSSNTLNIQDYATTERFALQPTMVFRDPSAWYHLVVAIDTTQATASNRIKVYVNGTQVTAFNTANYPSQNLDTFIDNNVGHQISGTGGYFDGYMAEVNFIDGQALTPSSFGATDAATGVWQPIAYTGTYGTNGFYLKFTDTTSTSTLGNDSSGNSNTWTVNNISLTSGATYDSMKDVPTLTDADTANYCVMNPLANGGTLSNGNLQFTQGASHALAKSTFVVPTTGLWYAESTVSTLTSGSVAAGLGLGTAALSLTATASTASGAWVLYGSDQTYFNRNSTQTSIVGTFAANDVLQIAIDLANSRAWVGKNNTWYDGSNGTTGNPATGSNPTFTSLSSELFVICNAYSNTLNANFGQRPFAYTPPSGFKALNTFNLPTPTIGATASTQANDYFDVTTYTGTGSSQSITNSGSMQPDFVWIKGRSGATDHGLYDAVRGVQKQLESNTTTAETTETTGLTAFNSNGFTVGALAQLNTSSATYVGWQWKANGAGSSNTAGSISSTVSANTTAGFSIVTYTGNGTNNATIGHGLGVTPSMVIVKSRTSGTRSWFVAHTSLATNNNLLLQTTDSAYGPSAFGSGVVGGLTSTVFECIPGTVAPNNVANINNSGDNLVAYCFAQVAGYSAFGSFVGNGSTDGTFVYLGFRPKYVMIKASSTTGNWNLVDSVRNPSNVVGELLYADAADAGATYTLVDFLSNGFKLRNSGGNINNSGVTYIYAAFAEFPQKFSLAR